MTEITDSTILTVKTRTMVNIMNKEVAVKLNMQLARSLNLIGGQLLHWRFCKKTFPLFYCS